MTRILPAWRRTIPNRLTSSSSLAPNIDGEACSSRDAIGLATACLMLIALADATVSFADTPGRLPKTVVPIHYSIDLKPDLEKSTLAGSELVDIEVREATDRVVLNALNLTVDTAAIEGESAQAAIAADTAA